MNKNIIIGVIAFGGLALIASNSFKDNNEVIPEFAEQKQMIPTDIPAFPIYSGTVTQVRDTDGDTARDISVSISTNASIAEINEWYRNALKSDGWRIKSDKNVAGYQIIQGENDNLYTSMQAANDGNGGANISQHLKIRK